MMRPLSPSLRSVFAKTALLSAVLLVGFGCSDAFAQATQFGDVQKNIGKNITQIPPLFAVASYAIGAFFAGDGLLKLKAWMEDSGRNSINSAIFRLAVSAMMIYLPHAIIIANTTLFGDGAGGSNLLATPPPKLGVFQPAAGQ